MELAESKNRIRENFSIGLRYFTSASMGLLLLFLLIRSYEVIYILPTISKHGLQLNYLLQIFFYEFIIFFEVSAIIGFLFTIVFLFLKRTAKILLITALVLLALIDLMLVLYFSQSKIPLGSDLFGYSLFEINETVTSAGGLSILNVVYLISFIIVITIIFILFARLKLKKTFINVFCFLAIITFFFISDLNPQPQNFSNTADYFAAVNKFQFFTSNTYSYFFEKELDMPIYDFYIESQDSSDISFKYTDSNYPFLHEENSPDVLSNYFNVGDKKPNFVFIITESLGRGYSGDNAYLGSFTPFLDSLAKQSLYWENFLSTGGRTFAVLPSLFGSLPFGEKGFLDMGESMPNHFSLIKYLKKYGYKVHFYYGGDSRFDRMDEYLKKQNVDLIVEEKNFGNRYKKMPPSGGGFSWGYGDKDLFKRSFEVINSYGKDNQLNIFLTLSMHSPFVVENMDYYHDKFEKIFNNLHLEPEAAKTVKTYKEMLSCVLYTDEAFREFMNEYKKREDFKNTIFIITGDHRMPEIPIIDQIDRFHVPLIIYSPLLKRTAKFSSISSHFDVIPSLLPFLTNQYRMEKVAQSTFIGSGLDTTREFKNIHRYPLMRNKNELLDYLYNDYFYSDNRLYRILDNLGIVPVEDNYTEDVIGNEFLEFRKKNDAMIKTKKLIPETLLK